MQFDVEICFIVETYIIKLPYKISRRKFRISFSVVSVPSKIM
jgi:hypothetical protein